MPFCYVSHHLSLFYESQKQEICIRSEPLFCFPFLVRKKLFYTYINIVLCLLVQRSVTRINI